MSRRKPATDPSAPEPVATDVRSAPEAPVDDATPADPTYGEPGRDGHAEPHPSPETDAAGQRNQRPWLRNFETLAVPGSGIYSGEDRKFAQVYIAFDKDRPTDEQKAKMTEAGFRYRAAEKRWDQNATPVSRVKAKSLVAEFTGVLLGAAQGR